MIKTVCFGEIMLRLSPPGFERLFQSPLLHATFGGGEANVAVSLAHFGLDSHYVTRLPANPVGDAALRALRAEGVRVEPVLRGGSRLGIYFAETGASQRPSLVVYDRAHSAIGELQPGAIPWEAGADIVKVFPATALGPGYFRDLRGPFPQLRLMPTGGVSLANAGEWIRAGAVAIGVGTALVDAETVAARRFDEITERARQFVAAVAAARSTL